MIADLRATVAAKRSGRIYALTFDFLPSIATIHKTGKAALALSVSLNPLQGVSR